MLEELSPFRAPSHPHTYPLATHPPTHAFGSSLLSRPHPKASERCPNLQQKVRSTSLHSPRRVASRCPSLVQRSYTTSQKCLQKPHDPSRLAPRGGELEELPAFLHQTSGTMLPFVGSKLLHHKSEMLAKTKGSKQTCSSRGELFELPFELLATHTPTPSPPTHPPYHT